MTLTKTLFRKECLNKMKKSPYFNRIYKNNLLNKKLKYLLKGVKNKNILMYFPLKDELDIRKSIKILRKNNNVLLPFMQNTSFKVVPFRLPLQKKKFNIYEAGNSLKKINNIDIAIVPVVGIDGNLQRVGFGKGMYDRFFAKLKKRPYTIFIQIDLCHTKEQLCSSYDIEADLVLTPKTMLYP